MHLPAAGTGQQSVCPRALVCRGLARRHVTNQVMWLMLCVGPFAQTVQALAGVPYLRISL